MAKFTSETAKLARAKWEEKYKGTGDKASWAYLGYWTLGEKYGFEIANKIVSGQHLTKSEYKKLKKVQEAK